MENNITKIQELLHRRAELQARLNLLPYYGSPEVKERNGKKYLYIRKRVASRLTSTYVDVYSDDLYQLLLRNARESRELKKNLRHLDKQLAQLGYTEENIAPEILLNIDLARANLKTSIYDQAILEGVATTFPQTEDILENGKVSGMRATDIQKILNLKHAWEFILDKDVISAPSDYYLLCHIAKLINEGFFAEGGRIRGVPVTIGGTSYVPPLPIERNVKEDIRQIVSGSKITDDTAEEAIAGKTPDISAPDSIDTAIRLCLYCMRAQIFNDGNKRAAVIFANHFLIAHGEGLLVIPAPDVPEFKKLLVTFYETNDAANITKFLKEKCWTKTK